MSKPKIEIYTDGGAAPNPGLGGWGVVLIHPQKTLELSGNAEDTTNNRMELTAAIEALRALKQPCEIDFYTDSEYLRKGITQWMKGWIAKGKLHRAATADGDLTNGDLWWQLHHALQGEHDIHWHWVKGHAGNAYNERADELATLARQELESLVPVDDTRTRLYLQIAGPANPKGGACGWAARVEQGDDSTVISDGHAKMSVNQFVVYAALQAIQAQPKDHALQMFINNSYLHDGITQWVNGWRRKGWEKPEKFKDLWQALDAENQARDIQWVLIKDDVPEGFQGLDKVARESRAEYQERKT